MNDNLIFLTDEQLDKNIYRIFSFDRLTQLFNEQKLTLVKPKKWDDPFENFILKSTGQFPDGTQITIGNRDSFYGQCWSLTKESDAMWRIYSPDKDGVKVKTTIRKLFEPFFRLGGVHHKINGHEYNLTSYIGKVKYQSTKQLTAMLTDRDRMSDKLFDQSGWGSASTFFFKRWAFRHENEVRLMYNGHSDSTINLESDIFKFDINPFEVIDEIVFDPRMDKVIYERNKEITESWGFDKKIIQSGLYKIKEFKMELNPLQ
tara:strand:- start:55 stop:834 length:780 start_codon:yes stop_codon:yes gene_type:complete